MSTQRARMLWRWGWLPAGVVVFLAWAQTASDAREPLPEVVEFNRDIRPILSDTCFHCHGPDKAKRKAKLRLDTEEGAFADLGDAKAIVPGQPGKSEVLRRITADNERERMPPANSGRKLTERQIQLLGRWIEQGGKWQKHWAFIPPRRPPLPPVKNAGWPRNSIDYFVLARLESEGLAPAPEADRGTLIRRVTLDLTGLPPTPAEVDAFLADPAADAYEKVVDRLLQSPRYGERMASRWLDAARYADTNGYQSDGERNMWRWRDWVIDAFNRNIPFDRFTIEQLAGDLLPSPTLEQKIATGFNRNHRLNAEGGIVPEEYAVEYVADRVETTSTVWLGLTMTCARCHDHKYDPLRQQEFYELYAFFNNIPERGKAVKYGNSPPVILAPTVAQQEELTALEARLAAVEKHFRELKPQITAAQGEWEQTLNPDQPLPWAPTRRLAAHFKLDGDTGNEMHRVNTPQGVKRVAGVFQDGAPAWVPGQLGQSGSFDGRRFINAGNVGEFGFYDRFAFTAWIHPQGDKGGFILSRMSGAARARGYSVLLEDSKVHVNLVVRWLDDAIRVETERRLEPNRWHHLAVTYDGSRWASGVKVYVNGRPAPLKVVLDELNQSFAGKDPLRIGSGGTAEDRFHGAIDDVRVYDDVLAPDEVEWLATLDGINTIAQVPADQRSPGQAGKIAASFLEQHAPEALRTAHQRLTALRQEKARFIESIPTTMVMEELPKPRDAFVLLRGVHDKPGAKVKPGVPAVMQAAGATRTFGNRLDLARWLVDPANPLTARVAVNRYWQMYFGTGLVKTVDDFGSQGEWPSHPELLDWLATEFMETRLAATGGSAVKPHWDSKALQRLIVTSATYRQASKVTKALWEKDPENRLLARGPRFRLSAESIRDQALAASGLLVERIGGPSVRPYQPAGLWRDLGAGDLLERDYVPDRGPNLYRRSLYTFWKRTVAPPFMMTFDASGREMCMVRETRTNTPLQALNLMNDVTYVEAARVLAQRAMTEGGSTPESRLTFAFRLATARKPAAAELQVLSAGFQHHLTRFRQDPRAALKLVSIGEYPRNDRLDVPELAAYTAVAGLILNLDETITKE